MIKFTLHMKEMANGVKPMPYIIGERGYVGRQKFWQGTPRRLLGFNSKPDAGDMDVINFIDKTITAEDIMLGINRYPVFTDSDGNWFTVGHQVETITEARK